MTEQTAPPKLTSIAPFIKELGRGKDGARALTREQATQLWGALLDGNVSDLEIGAVCIALRIKGETTQELLGFLDATHLRLNRIESDKPWVVLPSYNGARKLPVLAPLLAGLLGQAGAQVLVHGQAEDALRTTSGDVWKELDWPYIERTDDLKDTTDFIANKYRGHWTNGTFYCPTAILCPGLDRLLKVRRTIGLRNSAHSIVKLMNPIVGTGNAPMTQSSLVVGSYTHPEYLASMGATFKQLPYRAMLLRGTEGECVADARRCPQMDLFQSGTQTTVQAAQAGPLQSLPELPKAIDAPTTAAYIRAVLQKQLPVPAPIALQVECILHALGLKAP